MGNAGIYGQRRTNKIIKKQPEKKQEPKKEKPVNPLDLNNDGKVDKKDASIAGKVMANHRKKNKF